MPSFKGEYEHSVDAKGRVAFPAKLRKALNPEAQENFTLLRGLEPCLYLYPQNEWAIVETKLSSINSFTKEGRTVKRNFLRFAEDLTLDKQNRLPLPSHLMDWAGIDGRAIFIGSGERIEIWSPEKLEEVDANLSFESYQELFERVMGDNGEDDGE
ncbi:MAG: division/cell wall cluster transcriptional repressor MraZ [Balneolaceae bacterium]